MSTQVKDGLLYTKEDEWLQVDGDEVTIGITDYAQNSLSDIVFVELPEPGTTFSRGDTFGVVESVKAAADLYMPVSGEISAVNDDLPDATEQVNSDPYGAWMVRVTLSDSAELDDLMDADAYRAFCDDRD
jgi:glycine cleavage system H protein